MSPIISLLPPPGPSVLNIPHPPAISASSPSPQPPNLFLQASSIRTIVFVHEQHCSIDNEIDADDARSWHWICFASGKGRNAVASTKGLEDNLKNIPGNEEKTPVATVRLVPVDLPGAEYPAEGPSHSPTAIWNGREPYIKIGRLATSASHRGLGFGKTLMNAALQWAAANRDILSKGSKGENNGWEGLVLVHAQKEAERFYAGVDFVTDEGLGVWWEEGIEHVGMWRRI